MKYYLIYDRLGSHKGYSKEWSGEWVELTEDYRWRTSRSLQWIRGRKLDFMTWEHRGNIKPIRQPLIKALIGASDDS